jgi:hypothetical protein
MNKIYEKIFFFICLPFLRTLKLTTEKGNLIYLNWQVGILDQGSAIKLDFQV